MEEGVFGGFLHLDKRLSLCSQAMARTFVLAQNEAFNECALQLIENSAIDVTVGEIRETCTAAQETVAPVEAEAVPEAPESAIDRRLAMEGATEVVPFVMTPHKPNYIIYR